MKRTKKTVGKNALFDPAQHCDALKKELDAALLQTWIHMALLLTACGGLFAFMLVA